MPHLPLGPSWLWTELSNYTLPLGETDRTCKPNIQQYHRHVRPVFLLVMLILTSISQRRIAGENDISDELKPCRDRTIQLWRIGAAFPPLGEHVLRFPFSFPLPANSPPSMREQAGRHLAKIVYKLDLRGERNISFGFDMHIERCVQVVPPSPNIGTLRPTGGRDPVRMGGVDISRSVFKRGKGRVETKLSIPSQFAQVMEKRETHFRNSSLIYAKLTTVASPTEPRAPVQSTLSP